MKSSSSHVVHDFLVFFGVVMCLLVLFGMTLIPAVVNAGVITPNPTTTTNPPPGAGPQPVANPPKHFNLNSLNPLTCTNIPCVAGKIIDAMVDISIPIVAIMVLVGAFKIVTAAGSSERFMKGLQTIEYAAIGFVAVLLAGAVADVIQSFLS